MTVSMDTRALLIQGIEQGLAQGTLQIGEAVRRLRVEVTGLHQSQFARMCKISVRTLVHIEHGEGNQTLKSLNAVFRPFGLQMGVVRVRRSLGVSRPCVGRSANGCSTRRLDCRLARRPPCGRLRTAGTFCPR